MLGAFGNGADGWFEIEFGGVNFNFFSGMYGAKTGDGMGRVGDAKLGAKGERGKARMVVRDIQDGWVGDGAQEIAHEAVEFGVGDEVCGLLMAK
jgi:hypothetical protein